MKRTSERERTKPSAWMVLIVLFGVTLLLVAGCASDRGPSSSTPAADQPTTAADEPVAPAETSDTAAADAVGTADDVGSDPATGDVPQDDPDAIPDEVAGAADEDGASPGASNAADAPGESGATDAAENASAPDADTGTAAPEADAGAASTESSAERAPAAEEAPASSDTATAAAEAAHAESELAIPAEEDAPAPAETPDTVPPEALAMGDEPTAEGAEALALDRLEAKLDDVRRALRIPALSAGVVRDGELIWAKGFGLADVEAEIEATENTPYGLASVTKPFAAFLLMRLVEQGLLDLDTPAIDFGIDLGDDEITVRHLLSHTSEGLPGCCYKYSGDRYARLTAVIEQLYGETFRRVLRDEILEPLGMDDTALNVGFGGIDYYYSTLAEDDPERAFEHVYRDAAVPYLYDPTYEIYPNSVPNYANAAAGLISTVVDLATFAAAIERDALVSAETKARMFTPTSLTSGEDGPYGLGWFTETYGDMELIWHYGYGAYSTLFLMVPSEGLTFIALANTQNLSRPFGLGLEDVSVLASPVALPFFKELVLRPRFDEPLPDIDWAAGADAVAEQLAAITDPELRELYEGELWTYRKLYAGVGRHEIGAQLLRAHSQAFPELTRAALDLYQVGRPGPRPEPIERYDLSNEEGARWLGRYALREEDAASGLPLRIELHWSEGRYLAADSNGELQELIPVDAVRMIVAGNPELSLLGEREDGGALFHRASVTYGGEMVGIYERVE